MHADLHRLETEFTRNPTLETCLPLCEAYLAAKRYMEAMVVCKKGLKAAPSDVRGRAMLARIYFAQGKIPKTAEELQPLLQEAPDNAAVLELHGQVLLAQGRRDEGLSALRQAVQWDPTLAEATKLLQQMSPGTLAATKSASPAFQAPQPAPQSATAASASARARVDATQPAGASAGASGLSGAGAKKTSDALPGRAARADSAHSSAHGNTPAAMQQPAHPAHTGTATEELGAAASLMEVPAHESAVQSFFAPTRLGFADDNVHVETAGPRRLTIIGFVPKTFGSIKITLTAGALLLLLAGTIIAWQLNSARSTLRINDLLKQVQRLIDDDSYASYQEALQIAEGILAIDASHNLTLSTMAYVAAILAVEHGEADMKPRAHDYLRRAQKAREENEFRVAAQALLAYAANDYDTGIAAAKAVLDRGGTSAFIEMELFRLLRAARPESKETMVQLRRLVESAGRPRVSSFLGWYYYDMDDFTKAENAFGEVLRTAKEHAAALIGHSLVALERNLGLQERSKDIEASLQKVFSATKPTSKPVFAWAHFARATLRQWQGKAAEAEADFAKALELSTDTAMLHYRRGTMLLQLGNAASAMAQLHQAAQASPKSLRFLLKLAAAQIEAGALAEGDATLTAAQELNPKSAAVVLLWGRLRRAQKQYNDAVAVYERISADETGDLVTDAQIGIAMAWREAGQASKAVKVLEDFLSHVPASVGREKEAEIWCELGRSYELNGNRAQAIQSYEAGMDQYRYLADCHWYLCRALGQGAAAKQACQTYLTLAPNGKYASEARRRAENL